MSNDPSPRRLSYAVLCLGLLAVPVVFGVRASYAPALLVAIAAVHFVVIWVAAWHLGAHGVRADSADRRKLAVAGGLLVMAWALLALLPGMGTPWQATAAENQMRYVVLLLGTMSIAGGMVVLRQALSDAGERFYSALGFAAIMMGGPLYAVFAAIQLTESRSVALGTTLQSAPWIGWMDELSIFVLFAGVVLTYLAIAAFSTALARANLLGARASRAFAWTSLFAVLCVAIKVTAILGPAGDSIWGFNVWYGMPGFVLSIPAVPWIMPCLLGIILLRRAGNVHNA